MCSKERAYSKGSPARRQQNKSQRPRARDIDGIKNKEAESSEAWEAWGASGAWGAWER